jgi:predicted dehydrogenase
LKGIQGVRVLATGSRELTRAKEFSSQYGIERSYGSYEELAADPDVDIIYIASPHAFHASHAKLCLQNKKAVLCEKAFALNVKEVTEMVDAARITQTFLMEAFFIPFQPSYQEAHRVIDSGILGEIKHVHGWFGFNKSPYDRKGRLLNPALGGGALLDIGLYPIFDVLRFLGQPINIEAFADLTDDMVDQSVSVNMEFTGGKSATVFASFLSAAGVGTDILCEKGTLRLRRSSALNQSLEVVVPGEQTKSYVWDETTCGLKLEALEVMNCLENNKVQSELMSHTHSLQQMMLLDRIRAKAGIRY